LTDRGQKPKPPTEVLDWVNVDSCPQLDLAFKALPARPRMDAIIQCFFDSLNPHYYIIYPPHFLHEYQVWWQRRAQGQSVTLQWTSLLVMICSCTIQHLDDETRTYFDIDLGESTELLTKRYLDICHGLSALIPPGHCHILNIKRLLHTIYWYKAEATFDKAWHLIGAAIREAQELGFHLTSVSELLPDFESEMRRRLWCLLETWDWQFASGLGRPTIVSHDDVDIGLPTLSLEQRYPSPFLFMQLQQGLVRQLARRFKAPKNITEPQDIEDNQIIIERWMSEFPPIFAVTAPDTCYDVDCPWIAVHRYYIHTMAFLSILNPYRLTMTKDVSMHSSPTELQRRRDCVNYALQNISCTTQWIKHISYRDGRFHFIMFSLFDTSVLLSTIILKDKDRSVPRRDEILIAIQDAASLMRQLRSRSDTAQKSCNLLHQIISKVPLPHEMDDGRSGKRIRGNEDSDTSTVRGDEAPETLFDEPLTVPEFGSETTSPSDMASGDSAVAASTPMSNYIDVEGYTMAQVQAQHLPLEGMTMPSMPDSVALGMDGQPLPVMPMGGDPYEESFEYDPSLLLPSSLQVSRQHVEPDQRKNPAS
jgi:hypothetical protein